MEMNDQKHYLLHLCTQLVYILIPVYVNINIKAREKNKKRKQSEQDNKNEIKVEIHQENSLRMGIKGTIPLTLDTVIFFFICGKVQE